MLCSVASQVFWLPISIANQGKQKLGNPLKSQNIARIFHSSSHSHPNPRKTTQVELCLLLGFWSSQKRYFGPYIVKLASRFKTDAWDFLFHYLAEIMASSLSYNMVFYLKQHQLLDVF